MDSEKRETNEVKCFAECSVRSGKQNVVQCSDGIRQQTLEFLGFKMAKSWQTDQVAPSIFTFDF